MKKKNDRNLEIQVHSWLTCRIDKIIDSHQICGEMPPFICKNCNIELPLQNHKKMHSLPIYSVCMYLFFTVESQNGLMWKGLLKVI